MTLPNLLDQVSDNVCNTVFINSVLKAIFYYLLIMIFKTLKQWIRFCLIAFFLLACNSITYSQDAQTEKELAEAIHNAQSSQFEQAIPILKKYADAKGYDDFTILQINVYLNLSYLVTKNEALNVDKVNTLTDAYIAKYGISKTDTSRSADEATLLYCVGKINNEVGNKEKMVLYFTLINP